MSANTVNAWMASTFRPLLGDFVPILSYGLKDKRMWLAIATLVSYLAGVYGFAYGGAAAKGRIKKDAFTVSTALAWGIQPGILTMLIIGTGTAIGLTYLDGSNMTWVTHVRAGLLVVQGALVLSLVYVTTVDSTNSKHVQEMNHGIIAAVAFSCAIAFMGFSIYAFRGTAASKFKKVLLWGVFLGATGAFVSAGGVKLVKVDANVGTAEERKKKLEKVVMLKQAFAALENVILFFVAGAMISLGFFV